MIAVDASSQVTMERRQDERRIAQVEVPEDRRATDRRRGPRPYVAPLLSAISDPNHPPFRLRDIAAITGFSKPKLLADIRAGYLDADPDPKSGLWLIQPKNALRYLQSLGMIE